MQPPRRKGSPIVLINRRKYARTEKTLSIGGSIAPRASRRGRALVRNVTDSSRARASDPTQSVTAVTQKYSDRDSIEVDNDAFGTPSLRTTGRSLRSSPTSPGPQELFEACPCSRCFQKVSRSSRTGGLNGDRVSSPPPYVTSPPVLSADQSNDRNSVGKPSSPPPYATSPPLVVGRFSESPSFEPKDSAHPRTELVVNDRHPNPTDEKTGKGNQAQKKERESSEASKGHVGGATFDGYQYGTGNRRPQSQWMWKELQTFLATSALSEAEKGQTAKTVFLLRDGYTNQEGEECQLGIGNRTSCDCHNTTFTLFKWSDLTLHVGRPDSPNGVATLHVSRVALTLSSPVFDHALTTDRLDDVEPWVHEFTFPDDPPATFLLAMLIIHFAYEILPESPSSKSLVELGILCDKYDLREVLLPVVRWKGWLNLLESEAANEAWKNRTAPEQKFIGTFPVWPNTVDWIRITHMFGDHSRHRWLATSLAMQLCQYQIDEGPLQTGFTCSGSPHTVSDSQKMTLHELDLPEGTFETMVTIRTDMIDKIIRACKSSLYYAVYGLPSCYDPDCQCQSQHVKRLTDRFVKLGLLAKEASKGNDKANVEDPERWAEGHELLASIRFYWEEVTSVEWAKCENYPLRHSKPPCEKALREYNMGGGDSLGDWEVGIFREPSFLYDSHPMTYLVDSCDEHRRH